jgi:tetraacyldisaccharide 4'-kinase
VCLSRADAVAAAEREAIRRRVAELAPNAVWCELAHVACGLINSQGATQPLECLAGKRVVAFCGIGNPAGFRHTLGTTGCEIADWREFPDHHTFAPTELETLSDMARARGAQMVVCTQKDLVKAPREKLGEVPLWAVTIEMRFLSGQDALEQILERFARRR